ncbi:phosphoenolpyruvate synthase [Candidatus Woesearchaeota archaeon]|nr:phosphoenolpyruvate synthase [Candidatus Woesearchaeota archaeon]
MQKDKKFILWFDELGIEDIPLVGGKNASLGEMYRNLTKKGVRIPNGFAITSYAYRYLLEHAGITLKIRQALKGLNTHNLKNLEERGQRVRDIIMHAKFPEELEHEINVAYKKLCTMYGARTDVAVRSSATAEDLPDASFAGQQETYLNIKGERNVLEACKKCFASLFTNRAISYREDKKFDHFNIALSIGVQKMVRSDLACSGVMFSIDTESGLDNVVFLTGSYGLGEMVVQGAVNPDEYYIFKPTLRQGHNAIVSKSVGQKKRKMVYSNQGTSPTKIVEVPPEQRKQYVLTEKEILELARWATIIEDHYSMKRNKFTPMDMEWAKDGKTGQLFMVQARPETVQSQKDKTKLEEYRMVKKGKVLIEGRSVGRKIGAGDANVINDVKDIHKFKPGQVLVTDMTDPDWEPIMKVASAIVTNRGGRTCHAAIISREIGIPCVVGCQSATEDILSGQGVTVDCAEGDIGYVYEGKLKFKIDKLDLKTIPHTKTKIMMNVGNPEQAFGLRSLPNSGVGLAREEFIINSYIKIHPLALLEYDKLPDKVLKEQIEKLTPGYKDKSRYFVDKLAYGIATIAAAFYPHDVIVRMSDFKSNEYANLIGGHLYEPVEDNPMIGWRGASRYYSEKYKNAFGLECEAFKKVRDEMGLTNVKLMVPFCRTVAEGEAVQKEMAKYGLKRGKNKLELYVMCEIPANVILVDEFSKIFDGFSIGTNDLTQLVLGLDRDSELVADIYDERNEAVKTFVRSVIAGAKRNKRKIGICGQAPSDYPEFAEFLVECGIDSISLIPDTIVRTTLRVADMEKQLDQKAKKNKK